MSDLEKLLALDKELRWHKWPEEKPEPRDRILIHETEGNRVYTFTGILRTLQQTDVPEYHENSLGLLTWHWLPLSPLLKYLEEKEK